MKNKVVPINYTDDLENMAIASKGEGYVGIEEISITYIQPADTNSSRDEVQHLTLTTRAACAVGVNDVANNGCGFYFDVTIPDGEHWSINDGNDLSALVDDFRKRLEIGKEYIKPKIEENEI